MKKLLLAVLLAAWCPFNISAQSGSAAVTAFVGVNVIPMDHERVIENQTVVVSGGRIVAMGPTATTGVPDGATRIDGRGKFLMPGLADMHGHVLPGEGVGNDGPSQIMKLYLANGVTTVRGMMGHPTNLIVRDKIARGEIVGPRFYAASPPVNQKSVPAPEDAAKAVASLKAAGYDLIKVHAGLTPETYKAIADAAKREGIKIAGHVADAVPVTMAIEAGQSSIEHLDGYLQALVPADSPVKPVPGQVQFGPALGKMDESKMAALAEATRKAGVWNTPTLLLFEIVVSNDAPETYAAWPEMQYVPKGMRDGFAKQKAGTAGIPASADERARFVDLRRKFVKALHDAGAGLLVGPDSPQLFLVPGFATHREMAALAAAGLPPFAVLRAATVNPSAYFGTEKEVGTIATGMRADLLLLDANPLQNIANTRRIAGVMANGRWMPKTEIDQMLTGIAELHNQ